jgi:hypothetical protein
MTDAKEDLGFSIRQRTCGVVQVLRHGKLVATLRGADAAGLLAEADRASESEIQQLMARLTGNYKRGNERLASGHPRNRT